MAGRKPRKRPATKPRKSETAPMPPKTRKQATGANVRLKRTKEQIAIDRAEIAQMRLHRVSLWSMVERLNNRPGVDYKLTVKNVESDMKHAMAEWQRQQAEGIGEFVREKRAELGEILRNLWQLYFEAKAAKPIVEKTQKAQIIEADDPDGETVVTADGVKPATKKMVVPYEVTQKEKHIDWLNRCQSILSEIRQTVMAEASLMNDAIKTHLEMEAAAIAEEQRALSGDNPYTVEIVIEEPAKRPAELEEMQMLEIDE